MAVPVVPETEYTYAYQESSLTLAETKIEDREVSVVLRLVITIIITLISPLSTYS
jgi:hypothetical protein